MASVELRRGRRVGRGPAAELVGLDDVARGLRLVRGPARGMELATSWGGSNNVGRGFERERERNAFACIERHQAFALAPVGRGFETWAVTWRARGIALATSWGGSNNVGRGFETWAVTWRITWRMMWRMAWRAGVSDVVVKETSNDVALVGPAECAKSCLLRQLACFLQPRPIISKTLSQLQAECPGYHLSDPR